MTLLSFVWKNMVRNRRRTVLTVLSIGLSLFLLSTLMTVLTELERESEGGDQHLRLVVRRASSLGDPLPEAYLEKLPDHERLKRCADAARQDNIGMREANEMMKP